jgi:hypothetical protein
MKGCITCTTSQAWALPTGQCSRRRRARRFIPRVPPDGAGGQRTAPRPDLVWSAPRSFTHRYHTVVAPQLDAEYRLARDMMAQVTPSLVPRRRRGVEPDERPAVGVVTAAARRMVLHACAPSATHPPVWLTEPSRRGNLTRRVTYAQHNSSTWWRPTACDRGTLPQASAPRTPARPARSSRSEPRQPPSQSVP